MQNQVGEIHRRYQNVISDAMQNLADLTDDDKAFLSTLTDVINAAAEKGITDIETIAKLMHTSTATLRRRLLQTLSVTPKAFCLQVRMERAKYLLQNYRDITIADVAEKCGYSQMPNFTRAFKHYFGIMPSEVRKQ